MDAFLSSFLWGSMAPPLGNVVSRFRFHVVVMFGLALGMLFNLALVIHDIAFGGGLRLFLDAQMAAIERHGYGELLLQYLFAPAIFIVCLCLMRAIARPPTFEVAQAILEREGYEKHVHDGGRRIEYRKDRLMVFFRVDRRYGPPQAEWWRDGKRKGSILLRTSLHD